MTLPNPREPVKIKFDENEFCGCNAKPLRTVSLVWRNGKLALFIDTHSLETLVPALDNLTSTERQR